MKVLLSIKPEFAEKILNGSKKYEYRRVIFKNEKVHTVVLYASAPVGKVIGEFEIETIVTDAPDKLWKKTGKYAGINKKSFFNYFSNADRGYAIKVKNFVKYKVPKSLKKMMITSPPQSFMYLD